MFKLNFMLPFQNWYQLHPVIDSRIVLVPEQAIFFALKGRLRDGHQYVEELYQKGVKHFVVSHLFQGTRHKDALYYVVESPLRTLQQWASFHRNQFAFPIIAITGSNGKTIVKEWLYQLLSPDFHIVKSPKSYNSQIGVALSVLLSKENHQLGIFEAGISVPGEMEKLNKIIQPNIGIFTNIGTAHDDGFQDMKDKILEKLKLFQNESCESIIYCSDFLLIDEMIKRVYPQKKLISWGKNQKAKIRIEQVKWTGGTEIKIYDSDQTFSIRLPYAHQANIENIIHCIVLMQHLSIPNELIQERVSQLNTELPMRLEWKSGIQQCMIIDDTYNNDLSGLEIALDFQHQKSSLSIIQSKTVILSDILESGMEESELYSKISQLLSSYQVNRLIAIGKALDRNQQFFKDFDCQFFENTLQFINQLQTKVHFEKENILIKGARVFEFEKIVRILQKKTHNTVLELDLNALVHNYKTYQKILDPQTKTMVMVKAFAYGSSSYEVARLLQYHHVDYLGVAYVDEGVELRTKGIEVPIMVMNSSPEQYGLLSKYNLEPAIYSFYQLEQILYFIKQERVDFQKLKVHIELDTGMHRLGFAPQEIDSLFELLSINKDFIEPIAIFSHLAAADEREQDEFSKQQIQLFETISLQLEEQLQKKLTKHILNTAGISKFADKQFDMVRLGIGLHGIDPNRKIQFLLKPVATLKTTISQIRWVKAGAAVGYGRHSFSLDDRKIATLAIGYADGYVRSLGNGKGSVFVNGFVCPVVGNICMDMCFIDVSHVDVREGDEVILFGPEFPIEFVAEAAGTIPYELLTHISGRVPRIFYDS